jgi:hypothetical protein
MLSQRLPKSSLGKLAPTVHLPNGGLFIVLKSYFDKSGQEDQQLLTIGGVAAPDDMWAVIENEWNTILQNNDPPAAYMHMVEAIPLRGEFSPDKGWTDIKVRYLIENLLNCLTKLDKKRYCHFACSVKMAEYQKLQAETYQMDSPADLVASKCTDRITQWYFFEYKGVDLEAHYYFDQGEPFEEIIKARWNREREKLQLPGDYNQWAHITHIGPALMKKTPGLQVADMFAWATNRHEVKIPQRYEAFALMMRALIPSIWAVIDEPKLRKLFRPLIYKPYGNEQL